MRLKLFLALAAAMLTACSNNDNPLNPPIGTLRLANAISDSNSIDAKVEGLPDQINDVTFGSASGERDIPDGNYTVDLTTTVNNSDVTWKVEPDPVNIDKNHVTTVFAVGKMASGTQEGFAVVASDNVIDSNHTEVQFVDAASQAPGTVDIYVTAPGASLIGASPKATLAFKGSSGQDGSYAPGNYEVRVTPQNVPTTILFDSGSIAFPPAAAQQYVLIDHTCGGSPYALMIITNSVSGANVVGGC